MSGMDRREFLMGTAASAIVLWSNKSCSEVAEPAGAPEASPTDDTRLMLLRYAILAPNPHNAQSWQVELTGENGMRLLVDRSRLLPFSDPPARQVHIGQGTFLELLEMAARQHGYRSDMVYFPDGEYSNAVVEDRPVAAVTFALDAKASPDPLFAEISRRVSIKRPFEDDRTISESDRKALQASVHPDGIFRMTQSREQTQELARLCREAMEVEVSSRARDRETAAWFRFSDWELAEKRDGFGLAQNGVTGARKWLAEHVQLSREQAADPGSSFARGAITMAWEQAASASAFAALVGTANTRLEQVLMGRAYARIHLTATRLGLAMQPMSQLLEEYPEMSGLQQRMKSVLGIGSGQTVQMLFRLGYARPTAHSPRRDVRSLIRQQVRS